jgi:FMN-dependent NADH-azoreductase
MYNFNISAILKAYIDHIVRAGVTFDANYQGRAARSARIIACALARSSGS